MMRRRAHHSRRNVAALSRLAGGARLLHCGDVLLGFGLYGHGVYLAELNRLHGWSTSLISGATTAYYLLTATLVVFISDAIARLGPRRVMLIGSVCLGCAVALLPFIAAPWQLYAVYLIMAPGSAALHVGSISNVLGLWFVASAGSRSAWRSTARAPAASWWRRCW